MFEFQMVTNKADWEAFILLRPEANFLQSWNWGVFQEAIGKKVFRLAIMDNNQPIGAALIVKETAKRGNYLAIAGGPILDWQALSTEQLHEIFNYLTNLAKQEKCLFIRFRPQALDSTELRGQLGQLKIQPAPMHLTADLTLQLDLTQSEPEILAGMRKNTRYEIRQALKQNLTATISQNPEEIKAFYEHQLALAAKHHFVPFSYEFLAEQFKAFVADDQVVLISSFQGDKLLATAFVIFYNGEAVYHYGISTPDNDRLAGSYACQWTAIQEAKRRGCTRYNFWGIAPKDEVNHRFSGVSLFKRGFGGQEVAYLPAHDLPTSPLYKLTYFFEKLRKQARHL